MKAHKLLEALNSVYQDKVAPEEKLLRSDLEDKIGSLSSKRTNEIIEGIKLLVEPLPDPRS